MSKLRDEAAERLAVELGISPDDITFEQDAFNLVLWASVRISRLKKENVKMKEALEFYGDYSNYCPSEYNDEIYIESDEGKVARDILKELKYEIK